MDTVSTPSGTWERLDDKGWQLSPATLAIADPKLGWVQPAYGTNVVDFDNGSLHGGLRSLRGPGGLVVLRGIIKASGAIAAGETLATLAVGQRPGVKVVFTTLFSSGSTVRVQVGVDGALVAPSQAFALNDWLNLNGIIYIAEG
jgi:hypothetical protein